MIDLLKRWLKEARIEDETYGWRIEGDESLQFRLLNSETTKGDFTEYSEKYGTIFVPTVEIRPLAYGLRGNDVPTKPYTEPLVSGIYRKPAVLNEYNLGIARCDQQILILLATLDQKKVPIVVTFRSGNITVSNVEIK